MHLIANWRRVLMRAWSIRWMLVAGLFTGLEVALPLIDGLYPIPQGMFASMTGVAVGAAFVSRLLAQNIKDTPDAD
jgi:hypothetical protein